MIGNRRRPSVRVALFLVGVAVLCILAWLGQWPREASHALVGNQPPAVGGEETIHALPPLSESANRRGSAPLDPRPESITGEASGAILSRFRGEIWVVSGESRVLAQGTSMVRLVPRSEVTPRPGEGGWQSSTVILSLEDLDGDMKPSVCEGADFAVLAGVWEMPVPAENLVVWEVTSPSGPMRILDNGVIAAGSRGCRIEVEDFGFGVLSVVGRDGGALAGIDVLAVPVSVEGAKVRDMTFTESITFSPAGLGEANELLHPGPSAPKWATVIGEDLSSPIDIPLSTHDRALWIHKTGFGWQTLSWLADQDAGEVRLSQVGSLVVRLRNLGHIGGEFSLTLGSLNASGIIDEQVAHWGRLHSDVILEASDLPSGEYQASLRSKIRGGTRVIERSVLVHGGESSELLLDVEASESAWGDPGSLEIILRGYDPDEFPHLELVVSRINSHSMGAPFFDHPVGTLERVEDSYRALLPSLLAGTYSLGVTSLGIERIATVAPGSSARVEIDLTEVAHVRVWPGLADGETTSVAPRLLWRPVFQSDNQEVRRRRALIDPMAEAFLRRSHWNDGSWDLVCPPGLLTMMCVDESGAALSSILTVEVHRGPNEVEVPMKPGGALEFALVVKGLSEFELAILDSEIDEVLTAINGSGICAFASRVDDVRELKSVTAKYQLRFTEPGEYRLQLPPVGGKRPSGPATRTVSILANGIGQVEVAWQ